MASSLDTPRRSVSFHDFTTLHTYDSDNRVTSTTPPLRGEPLTKRTSPLTVGEIKLFVHSIDLDDGDAQQHSQLLIAQKAKASEVYAQLVQEKAAAEDAGFKERAEAEIDPLIDRVVELQSMIDTLLSEADAKVRASVERVSRAAFSPRRDGAAAASPFAARGMDRPAARGSFRSRSRDDSSVGSARGSLAESRRRSSCPNLSSMPELSEVEE